MILFHALGRSKFGNADMCKLYQVFTTNWCCVFTVGLLPGRNFKSRSTCSIFFNKSICFTFFQILCENVSRLAIIFKNKLLICCQPIFFKNSFHIYRTLLYKPQVFNFSSKCGIQFFLHFPIERNYIRSANLFIIFFNSMLLTSTPYFFLLSAFQEANLKRKHSNLSHVFTFNRCRK